MTLGSLYLFSSRTNLKLHNISVTRDGSKAKRSYLTLIFKRHDGSDFITVVVLKNREPELSYILAELFNKFLKGSSCVFQIVGRFYR